MRIEDSRGVFESDLLKSFSWVEHGFGSRRSPDWPGDYTRLKQIHSSAVITANGQGGCLGEGDALITARPGEWIGVRTADCVPILLVDPEHRAVGVVHAGWRGTIQGIAERTIERMKVEFGTVPEATYAAIGPAIGKCCFEVGPEVAVQFDAQGSTHVDLVEANYRQLLGAGLEAERIDVAGLCTKCESGLFHSFRRDKEKAGRMVTAITIRE